jgi:hypothetical protein
MAATELTAGGAPPRSAHPQALQELAGPTGDVMCHDVIT